MATAKSGGDRQGVAWARQIASAIARGLMIFGVADRRFLQPIAAPVVKKEPAL
jgi:hypothetical protein